MRRIKKVLAGMAAFVLFCGIVSVTGVSAYTCPYDCDVNQDGQEDIDKTNGTSSDNENVATRITEPVLQFYNNNPNIGY